MRKILLLALHLFLVFAGFTQTLTLNSNGSVIRLQTIDSLAFYEYPATSDPARQMASIVQNERVFNLSHSRGFIANVKNEGSGRIAGIVKQQVPAFSSDFYKYEDGTLLAVTSSLFFKPVNEKAAISEMANYGAIMPHPTFKGYFFIHVNNSSYSDGARVIALCNELKNKNVVSVIEPVFIRLLKTHNPIRPQQWNILNTGQVTGATAGADMGVENAWCVATGNGIQVAVIDDGVDLTHPDLQANLLPGFDATGNNSGGAPDADDGHGTNCAGIIASVDNTIGTIGVAFNADIIPIRMGTVTGNTFNTSDTWIANCFTEAVNRGADVISCSWGGGPVSAQINTAINNAVQNGRGGLGTVVLFSVGNDNANIGFPSTNPNVIAVGASSPCDTRKRSSNIQGQLNPGVQPDPEGTSCDGEAWWGSNFGTGLDVLAPGVLISTTDNTGWNGFEIGDYNDHFNGSSAACPNAAGVIALILSTNPNLTGQQARNILESTCFKIPNGNFQPNVSGQPNGTWSTQAGYGRVNAGAALVQILSQLSISGPDLVCNPAIYSITGLPAGSTAVWSAGSWATVTPQTPNGSEVLVTRNSSSGGVYLTAQITNNCGGTVTTLSKWIKLGPPDQYTLTPYYTTTGYSGYLSTINCLKTYTFPGMYSGNIDLTDQVATSFNWTFVSKYPSTATVGIGGSADGAHMTVTVKPLNARVTYRLTRTNSCGSYYSDHTFVANGPCGIIESKTGNFNLSTLAIAPNPVKSVFTVTLKTEDKRSIHQVIIKNKSGLEVKNIKYGNDMSKSRILNIHNLPTDVYLLMVFDGDKWVSEKIIKQ